MAALLIVTFMVGTAAFMTSALAKADTVTTNVKYQVEWTQWVPCAMDGAGESVTLSGEMHKVYHATVNDGCGSVHITNNCQPQRITGIGLTSGDKYRATGVTQGSFNGWVGTRETDVNNFRIIGQGPGNNFLLHETVHITVNANGEVTADVDNYRFECK